MDRLERMLRADSEFIFSNSVRVSIINYLLNSSITGHSASLNKLSSSLGKRPSLIHYHLKLLEEYNIVKPISSSGRKVRTWGLNTEYLNALKNLMNMVIPFLKSDENIQEEFDVI